MLACYLQRLSHLNIESCKGISSIAESFNDIKLTEAFVSSYFESLNPPNQSGLPGCKLLQYLNISNCTGMTINSIETFVRAYGKFLNVSKPLILSIVLYRNSIILPHFYWIFEKNHQHSYRSRWMGSLQSNQMLISAKEKILRQENLLDHLHHRLLLLLRYEILRDGFW